MEVRMPKGSEHVKLRMKLQMIREASTRRMSRCRVAAAEAAALGGPASLRNPFSDNLNNGTEKKNRFKQKSSYQNSIEQALNYSFPPSYLWFINEEQISHIRKLWWWRMIVRECSERERKKIVLVRMVPGRVRERERDLLLHNIRCSCNS